MTWSYPTLSRSPTTSTITLANRTLDNIRRRVQQQTLEHRERKKAPLYTIRRLLNMGEEKLTNHAASRITAMLTLGNPNTEIAIAYHIKERLRQFYQQSNIKQATTMLEELINTCTRKTMPEEKQQLDKTLTR